MYSVFAVCVMCTVCLLCVQCVCTVYTVCLLCLVVYDMCVYSAHHVCFLEYNVFIVCTVCFYVRLCMISVCVCVCVYRATSRPTLSSSVRDVGRSTPMLVSGLTPSASRSHPVSHEGRISVWPLLLTYREPGVGQPTFDMVCWRACGVRRNNIVCVLVYAIL